MKIEVTGGELTQEEKNWYIAHVQQQDKGRTIEKLEIEVDGDFVNLRKHYAAQPFERIRRITGYLVGDMGRWNNAKTAEERDRVKHV